MWRSYLTVGLRALTKNKIYSLITIAGLAIGMAACLTILAYVRYETTYDRDTAGAEQAYQFQLYIKSIQTGDPYWSQNVPYVSLQYLKTDFPQIEDIIYVGENKPRVRKGGDIYTPERSIQVSGNLFRIVKLPFVHGNRETALDEVGSVVLTESQARAHFGRTDVVGETITFIRDGKPEDHRITGVLKDLPGNTHLTLGMITRFDPATYYADYPEFLESWGEFNGHIYLSLRPGADAASVNGQLRAWEQRRVPEQLRGAGEFEFINIRDIHLREAKWGFKPNGDQRTLDAFAIVAILILLMACVNFINLSTARASQRAREVALRKVLGANRQQLVSQFLTEFLLMTGAAMLIALAIFELVVPPLATFLGADLRIAYFGRDGVLLPLLGIALATGVIGGLYPAFFLSRFQPAAVLKANMSTGDPTGPERIRSLLVLAQFAISIALIVCTTVIYQQTDFARTFDPGYDRNGVLQVQNVGSSSVQSSLGAIMREIGQIPGVTAVGRTEIGVNTDQSSTAEIKRTANAEPISVGSYAVDSGFFEAMGIRLRAGEIFRSTPPDAPDTAEKGVNAPGGKRVVLNAFAARNLGFRDPAQAIGKTITSDDEVLTIVGVVEDSRFRSVRDPLEPIMFSLDPGSTRWMIVRYNGVEAAAVRDRVAAVWKRLVPDVPFEARFGDEIVGALYNAETARAKLFATFAVLAIVIACLGLFGLANFTAERRTKEIGIRKVLGARTRDIVRLLAWQFSKPVILANLVAWPIAWWAMRSWLNGFETRVDLQPTPFILAAAAALALALGTIASHAVRVARTSPVVAVRYE